MTKKDYVKFAQMLSMELQRTDNDRRTVENVARAIATVLAGDNSKFDRQRFLLAAGVDTKE